MIKNHNDMQSTIIQIILRINPIFLICPLFGKLIKKFRDLKIWTQRQICSQSEWTYNYLFSYEITTTLHQYQPFPDYFSVKATIKNSYFPAIYL